MEIIDALKLIVAKSPRAAETALRTIAAARNNSPVLQTRYTNVLIMALADPEAEFTPEERQVLSSGIESPARGRPTMYEDKMRQTAVYLNDEQIAWLKSQPGTMSEVIRSMIDQARKS